LPSLDSLSSQLARNEADLAGLFYGSLGVPDSAAFWYTHLLKEHPSSPFAPKALYTLAQISDQDSSISSTKVDSLYAEIIERYPDSKFADAARVILGLPARQAVQDTTSLLYARAEQLMEQDSIDAAIAIFRAIADSLPPSPYAAKAQYAIGWIYEQMQGMPDSAIANYQRLVARFPSTTYAAAATTKLNATRSQPENNPPPRDQGNKQVGPPRPPLPGPGHTEQGRQDHAQPPAGKQALEQTESDTTDVEEDPKPQ
jgi:TolA-binding protein